MTVPTLRKYQTDALAAVCAARASGQNRVLVKKPTGTGKTVMFSAMPTWPEMRAFLEQFPRNDRGMLVIAHREELLDQAARKMLAANPQMLVSIEQADRHAHRQSEVVIASIQTLAARGFTRLKRLIERRTFRLVIIDEAHHAAADTYRTALVHLGFLPPEDAGETENTDAPEAAQVAKLETSLAAWDLIAPRDRFLVGVTATPNRSDAVGLGCVFQSIPYSYNLKDAIDDGWLVPIVPWVVETQANLDGVKLTAGDFNQKQLAAAVNTALRNQLAVAGWLEHAADRQTLAFTVDVAHAHALAAEFEANGIVARAVSALTPKDERRATLRAFENREIQVITNCAVFTEGVDLPLTSCVLMAKPTKSATLYEQCVGRGLRIHPGKTDCILLDVVDIARRHSLQTAAILYGLPPNLVIKGKKLNDAATEFEAFLAKHPGINVEQAGRKTLAELQAIASTFSVWEVRDMSGFNAGLTMGWIRTGDDAFRLQYPWGAAEGDVEVLKVRRELIGKFDLVIEERPIGGLGYSARVLANGLPSANECMRFGEQFIRQARQRVTKILDTAAPWKQRPASPKQIAYLRRLGMPVSPTMTMGQASALIDTAAARGR